MSLYNFLFYFTANPAQLNDFIRQRGGKWNAGSHQEKKFLPDGTVLKSLTLHQVENRIYKAAGQFLRVVKSHFLKAQVKDYGILSVIFKILHKFWLILLCELHLLQDFNCSVKLSFVTALIIYLYRFSSRNIHLEEKNGTWEQQQNFLESPGKAEKTEGQSETFTCSQILPKNWISLTWAVPSGLFFLVLYSPL